jgi:hypothetical protein
VAIASVATAAHTICLSETMTPLDRPDLPNFYKTAAAMRSFARMQKSPRRDLRGDLHRRRA